MARSRRTAVALITITLATLVQPMQSDAAGRSSSSAVNTILNGKGSPKSSLGINGDFYIDTRSLLIYGPKSKGKWPTPQSIQGPTGSTGSDGKNGADGKVVSNSNISSSSGGKGETGAQGEKGEQGPAGAPGIAGAIGPVGPAGPAGAMGPAGSSGSNGSNGAAGATGATGAQGVAGAKGETGTTGPSEVTVIALPTFSLSTNTQFGFNDSAGFGVLASTRDYQFSVHLRGTSSVDSHVLGIDVISPGNEINFSYSKSYFRYATYSTTANWYALEIFGTIKVRAGDSNLTVRVIDGFGDSGTNPLTFTGKAYITLVGAIR
jgi:hypothetical protein